MDFPTLARVVSRYEAAELDRTLDPSDVMWRTAPDCYWDVGRSGLECVLRGLAASPLDDPQSILDLACGYGRVGRHLRAAFPDARFFWCDIEGADFCAARFGGEAIMSSHSLLDVELPTVDVVWIGSLFTHLTEQRTRIYLDHIASCLNPGGVIVATFHGWMSTDNYRRNMYGDMGLLARLEKRCKKTGWAFEPSDKALDPEWGYSLTTAGRIAEIARDVAGMRIGSIAEGAWAGNHDVLTLVRLPDLAPAYVPPLPSALKRAWWRLYRRFHRDQPAVQ